MCKNLQNSDTNPDGIKMTNRRPNTRPFVFPPKFLYSCCVVSCQVILTYHQHFRDSKTRG